MALRLRRGLSTQLGTITPVEGELLYTTDTKRLYVGDGATVGGNSINGAISSPFSVTNNTSSTSSTTGALVVTGGVGVGGDLNVGGTLQPAVTILKVARDFVTSITANTSTTTLDLSLGNTFYVTVSANTTFAFSNVPTGTNLTNFSIITYNSAGGYAISWPASVTWAGAQTPSRTTTSGKSDVYTFFTLNAGTTIIGSLSILGY